MILFLTILLIFAVILEGTVTTLPLALVCLICFTIFKRDSTVFPYAFFAGLFIDVFHVQMIGGTSLFYLCALLFILLYKKKYEIYSLPFVMLATFLGSFFYLLIFHNYNALFLSFVSAGVAVVLFIIVRLFDASRVTGHKDSFLPV